MVEAGAGVEAGHPDSEYTDAGGARRPLGRRAGRARGRAHHGRDRQALVWAGPDRPSRPDFGRDELALASGGVTSFAMEAIPRITRAQAMDALVAGQRRGLRRHALRRARGRPVLPDDDHGRRHGRPGEGDGARRRRRGPAGDRYRSGSARSSPASTSGAPRGSRSPRSEAVRWSRLHPRRGGRGRRRAAADRRGERAGTRGSRRERGQAGRDHHDRADPRAPGANPPHPQAVANMAPGW